MINSLSVQEQGGENMGNGIRLGLLPCGLTRLIKQGPYEIICSLTLSINGVGFKTPDRD